MFDNVTTDMSIYTDEIFGPVLSIVRARDYDEAVKLCNMAFVGWPERKEHGIRRAKVVLSSSRYSILAESTRKASGEEACR